MASQLCFNAPSVEMKNLENLWFQLANGACNYKCKHCFQNCSTNYKSKNFLQTDKIKSALEETAKHNIKEIVLDGGEPFLHPDLNNIIRLTLKISNVCILTNGSLINDKKARFLRQIENEHNNELIFRVSIDHYLEEKNDEIRGRNAHRKAMSGIENLLRYGFNPIISIVNIWNEEESSLIDGFTRLFKKISFEPEEINFKIMPVIKLGEYAKNYGGYNDSELVTALKKNAEYKFDCTNTRVVTQNGIYACPLLTGDPRGKLGNTIEESSNKVFLETNPCFTCLNNSKGILNNTWAN